MSPIAIGLVFAVAASIGLNAAYVLQHAGAGQVAPISARRPVAAFRALLSRPVWLAGVAIGLAGWALHIAALAHAPLSLVQAFVAGGLALTAPLAVRLLGHRLRRVEWAGVALMTGALVALALGGRAGAGAHSAFGATLLGAYLGGGCALAAVLAAAPAARRLRAPALGLAGGLLYGVGDTAIKALTGILAAHGVLGVLRSPWLAVTALATLGGFFCFQRALQLGRPIPVIALMTAGTNVVSIVAGFVVFGDPLGTTPALVALHAAGFALAVVAAAVLTPVQAAVLDAPGEHAAPPPDTVRPVDAAEEPASAARPVDAAASTESAAGAHPRPAAHPNITHQCLPRAGEPPSAAVGAGKP